MLTSFKRGGAEQINSLDVDAFATHRIDFIACYDRSGELVVHQGGRLSSAHRCPDERCSARCPPAGNPLHRRAERQQAVAWFSGVGKKRGTVRRPAVCQWQRYYCRQVCGHGRGQAVSDLTKFVSDVTSGCRRWPAGGFFTGADECFSTVRHSMLPLLKRAHIAGYTLFRDLYDKPVLLLKITEQRLIYQQGKASHHLYTACAVHLRRCFLRRDAALYPGHRAQAPCLR